VLLLASQQPLARCLPFLAAADPVIRHDVLLVELAARIGGLDETSQQGGRFGQTPENSFSRAPARRAGTRSLATAPLACERLDG
jgi:hypothetical protein